MNDDLLRLKKMLDNEPVYFKADTGNFKKDEPMCFEDAAARERAKSTLQHFENRKSEDDRPLIAKGISFTQALDDFKRELIKNAYLEEGSWAKAARRLGLERTNLHHLATRLGITNGPITN